MRPFIRINMMISSMSPRLCPRTTVPERQGWQKTTPQKNAEKINKFIKCFVEINKNEVNKNCRQKKSKKTLVISSRILNNYF